MITEQRNKVIDELLKKCVFIGSKTIKVTEQDVEALKDCYLGAKRWDRLRELPRDSRTQSISMCCIDDIEQEVV